MDSNRQNKEYLKNLTILYVEDEEYSFNQLSQWLSRYCGTLLTARNGAEGLAVYQSQLPDIVITDIHMPIMDGLTMAQQIRALGSSVPIVAVTAFEQTDYLKRALDVGIDKYVTKPININLFPSILIDCAHNLVRSIKNSRNTYRIYFRAVNICSRLSTVFSTSRKLSQAR